MSEPTLWQRMRYSLDHPERHVPELPPALQTELHWARRNVFVETWTTWFLTWIALVLLMDALPWWGAAALFLAWFLTFRAWARKRRHRYWARRDALLAEHHIDCDY